MEGDPIEFWLKRPSDANKRDTKLSMSPMCTLADVKAQVHREYDDRPETACITVSPEQLMSEHIPPQTVTSARHSARDNSGMRMRCAVDPRRKGAQGRHREAAGRLQNGKKMP